MLSKNLVYYVIGAVAGIAVVVLLVFLLTKNSNEIIVHTNSGAVRGVIIESDIANFVAFFSIPYAKPPLNELRFMAPVPTDSWEGTHDGTKEGPACPQLYHSDISEDCLKLTVYNNNLDITNKAVFVSLHGGALEMGSAKIASYGPHFMMQHDIIVVTVQFRLSIFGFLNLNLEDAPGNMGLADVILALKWIKENIEFFGGDPNRVTLGGVSSGGIMTHALQLSPQAHGLFQKAIISSGTALSYRFFHEDIDNSVLRTKQIVNMVESTNKQLVEHLKSLNVTELSQMSSQIRKMYPSVYAHYFPYVITKDYFAILSENPLRIIQSNNYQHLHMLIGTNSAEGIRMEVDIPVLDYVNENFHVVVPTDLYPIDDLSYEKNYTARVIKEFYFGENYLSKETFSQYADMCMDSWYSHITDYTIRLQGNSQYNGNIYYYMFAVDGAYNIEKILNNITSAGANHGDDLGYLWKIETLDTVISNDNYSDLSRDRFVAMWSNFIMTGHITDYTIRLQGNSQYNGNIYYYMFAVDGAYNIEKILNNITSAGANHGDDLGYLWKIETLDTVISNDNYSDLSRDRFVAMWSNFIMTGNPTPEVNALIPIKWQSVEYPDLKYLLFNNTLSIARDPRRKSLLFWQRLYSLQEL